MATVLLAIGGRDVMEACCRHLGAAGHVALPLRRELDLLSLPHQIAWDAVCVDDSEIGHYASMAGSAGGLGPVVGLGVDVPGLAGSIRLPLAGDELLAAIDSALGRQREAGEVRREGRLRLMRRERKVAVGEREVALTRIQFRLLEVLLDQRPGEASLAEVLRGVWGYQAGAAGSELVRAHIRNLRVRLGQIGLEDAVRSRQGRGYAIVI